MNNRASNYAPTATALAGPVRLAPELCLPNKTRKRRPVMSNI